MPSVNLLLEQILAASGGAGSGFTKTYWFDANDTATDASPIVHIGGAADTYLTNDALGGSTNAYNPDSKDVLWNPVTNKFDFTSLKIGDIVDFRLDLTFDNAAAQEIDLFISIGEGQADPYEKPLDHVYNKTAGTNTPVTAPFKMYIGDARTRDGGCRFRLASPVGTSIKVIGWFYQITEV
tara:strand:+ start:1139 stop:1681 length:543 start_codon:yes stop_codon:yes gene_type:complete